MIGHKSSRAVPEQAPPSLGTSPGGSSSHRGQRGGQQKRKEDADDDDCFHAASDRRSDRRTGLVWSSDDAHGARLHSVDAPVPLRGCMKVSTHEDALRIADENDRRRRERRRAKGRAGHFSVIGRSVLRRGGIGAKHKSKRSLRRSNNGDNGGDGNRGGGNGSSRGSVNAVARSLNKKRRVSFSTLRFRWYELRAVDNPGVSRGPAIGAGWRYEEDEEPTPVDVHEAYRQTEAPRRLLKEIRLSTAERERRLTNLGVSRAELERMRRRINLAKGKRKSTLEGMGDMEKEERREGVIRKLKKIFRLKKKYEREEEDLWDRAQDRDDAPLREGSGHRGMSAAY